MAKEIYALSRNTAEADRLNRQHIWLKQFNAGDILHKSIPLQRFRSTRRPLAVADTGTGTGAWLLDFASQIDSDEQAGSDFIGFDISTSLVNAQHASLRNTHHVEFVLHDTLEPFPAKYHARFDIVHVRLLVCAVARSAISKVLCNLRQILKPGGYLAWHEAAFADFTAQPAKHPIASATYQRIESIVNNYGGSTNLPDDILATIIRESPPAISSLSLAATEVELNLSEEEGSNRNSSPGHLRLVAFERSTSSVFEGSSRQIGHEICCQVWANAIRKAMEKVQKEEAGAGSNSDHDAGVGDGSPRASSGSRRDDTRRKIALDQQVVEELDRAAYDGSFEWRLAFTWIVAQRVSGSGL